MLSGFTIAFLPMALGFLLWSCGHRSNHFPLILLVHMCSVVPSMSLTPLSRMAARQGIFFGFSNEHSSLVPLVFNPRTQCLSPWHHIIFDNAFSTLPSLYSVEDQDRRFEELFHTSRECFLDPTDTDSASPPLDDKWLSPDELAQHHPVPTPCQTPLVCNPMSLNPAHIALPPLTIPVGAAPLGPLPSPVPAATDEILPMHPPPTVESSSASPLPIPCYPACVRSGNWKDRPALD